MRSIVGPLWKSTVFVVATTAATMTLAFTIQSGGSGDGTTYRAEFVEAPSLNPGDDVRIAGVRVGQVTAVDIVDRNRAAVTFTVDDDTDLTGDVGAAIRYRNLIGQRYVALDQGTQRATSLRPGATIPLERTEPALDLTQLFNGFQPLFRMLSPQDVNQLSMQIIQVFQGEGGTVDGLVSATAQLTSTLAAKDEVIGDLITHLDEVMSTVANRSTEMTSLVVALQQLTSGLAEDRTTIGAAVEGLGQVTTSVGGLLGDLRPSLDRSIDGLDDLSGHLVDAEDTLDEVLTHLPDKLERLGRTASYGSWLNFYVCEVSGNIPDPEGYVGGVGVDSPAERCGA